MLKTMKNRDTRAFPVKEWEPLFRGEEAFGARMLYSEGEMFYLYYLPVTGSSESGGP